MLEQIAFIGGGNMATALVGGLINDGLEARQIHVSDPNPQALDHIKQNFQVNVSSDNISGLLQAQCIVLAVKPQAMSEVCKEIAPSLQNQVILSIAAGITIENLEIWLGKHPLIRAMPNTPALVGSGASALFANSLCNDEQKSLAESLMRAVGTTIWLEDENLMNAVTALSGSGPAYFFQLMETMIEKGESMGLSQQQSHLLTVQTAIGAAKLALESSENPKELRQRVTSPGGTTEAALQVMQANNLTTIIKQAIEAAQSRSAELAKLLGAPK